MKASAKCRNVNFKSVTFISVAFYTIQVIQSTFTVVNRKIRVFMLNVKVL